MADKDQVEGWNGEECNQIQPHSNSGSFNHLREINLDLVNISNARFSTGQESLDDCDDNHVVTGTDVTKEQKQLRHKVCQALSEDADKLIQSSETNH